VTAAAATEARVSIKVSAADTTFFGSNRRTQASTEPDAPLNDAKYKQISEDFNITCIPVSKTQTRFN
jgi:hypothetical protein